MPTMDAEIVSRTYEILADYADSKLSAHEAIVKISRAVILKDVTR